MHPIVMDDTISRAIFNILKSTKRGKTRAQDCCRSESSKGSLLVVCVLLGSVLIKGSWPGPVYERYYCNAADLLVV